MGIERIQSEKVIKLTPDQKFVRLGVVSGNIALNGEECNLHQLYYLTSDFKLEGYGVVKIFN